MNSMRTIVILGGYGNFGKRIARALASDQDVRLIIAGRDDRKAIEAARSLRLNERQGVALDARSPALTQTLRALDTWLVIHTAGPFQDQDYSVARACIDAGSHYIDLADGRAFVCGIDALNASAKRNDVLVVSGVSSLPALSSAAIDQLRAEFSRIDSIDIGISSGALPPGQSTMRGVFAYIGKPFLQWRSGTWHTVYGWQGLRARRYPRGIGTRWLAYCDVPDLELFPGRYSPVQHVIFKAGVGASLNMFVIWLFSWFVRSRLLNSLLPLVPTLHASALRLAKFGSKRSAMHVWLHGIDQSSQPIQRQWCVLANNDHGPNIPCFPAISLSRKLLRGDITVRGAQPCVGLLSVEDILSVGADLEIETLEER